MSVGFCFDDFDQDKDKIYTLEKTAMHWFVKQMMADDYFMILRITSRYSNRHDRSNHLH